MEIEKKTKEPTIFGELSFGDVFIDRDGDVMIVVTTDFCLGLDENYYGYAVNLATGSHYGYQATDIVVKMSAKLTITN